MPLFLLNLLSGSKFWLYGISAVACLAVGGYVTHQWDKSALESALAEQKTALIEECEKNKAITKGANDALQKDRDAIAAKLIASKQLHPAKCVPITRNAITPISGGRPAGQNGEGISSDWLRDFAAEDCATYRSQRMILEKFIQDERK